jgi:serine/threonine-protein kinase
LAAVLTREPKWDRVPLKTQPLLALCLEKDPKRRLRDIGDARVLMEGPVGQTPTAPKSRLSWMVAAVLAVAAIVPWVLWWRDTRPVVRPLVRFSVDLGPEAMPGLNLTVAISPDGRRLVFPARGPDGNQQLATRLLDQTLVTFLPGTAYATDPFFSPNGEWIGFFTGNDVRKTSVQGGAPVSLVGVTSVAGASWGADDNIIAAVGTQSGLHRIPAAGGPRQTLTTLGPPEMTHRWPQVLPGAKAVLFTAAPTLAGMDNANIEALLFKTGEVKVVQRGGYYGRYLPSGHLVYVRQGVLFGVKFDPDRLEVHGSPIPVLEDIAANSATGGGQFDFSTAPSGPGTFVFAAGKNPAQAWEIAWLDGSGKLQSLMAAPGAYVHPRLSPDGRKLAFMKDGDIYIHDLERDTPTRLTFSGNTNGPVWAPDSKHLVFQMVSGGSSFNWVRSDGARDPQKLLEMPDIATPWSLTRDGRLAFLEQNPQTGVDVWTVLLDLSDPDHPKAGTPEPFLRTQANETVPRFSPDGHWIAYRSGETGANEVYVRPFPAASGGKWQISTGGGLYGLWSNKGRELFYETADHRIMVLEYTVEGATFVPGKPRLWSDRQLFYAGTSNLDLAPDGKRFAVLMIPESGSAGKGSVHVTVLLNFFDELRRKLP